ncbi:MAG: transcriptional regulator, partial [Pseudonocardiaceae bacterium]
MLAGQRTPDCGLVSVDLPPSVQRILAQMSNIPVSVFGATWTLIAWNSPYCAVMGDPPAHSPRERDVVWQHLTAPSQYVHHTAE